MRLAGAIAPQFARFSAASGLPSTAAMPPELTIVIADVTRKAAIAAGFRIPGRVAHFTNRDLSAALEAVKTHQPRMVAIDALVAQTQQGIGLIRRIESLAMPQCAMVLIVRADGGWRTTPLEPLPTETTVISVASPKPVRPAIFAAPVAAANTRRAPRFPLLDSVDAARRRRPREPDQHLDPRSAGHLASGAAPRPDREDRAAGRG